MLRQRLLTAAVLIPLFAGAIWWLPAAYFALFIAAVVVIGGWEWAGLAGLGQVWQRVGYALAVALLLYAVRVFPAQVVVAVAVLWWCAAAVLVARADPAHEAALPGPRWPVVAMGAVVLIPAWYALVTLHSDPARGPGYVLFLVALVAVADSAAYFTGKAWGRTKLAARVSPGKTWEGFAGALVFSALTALGGAAVLRVPTGQRLWFVGLCVVTVAFSVVGDLLESLSKRRAGVKDSGRLLPGHGGVLDRMDSITAAAPVFTLGLLAMEQL